MLTQFVCVCVCVEKGMSDVQILSQIILSSSQHCICHDRSLKRTLSHCCNADSLQCLLVNPGKSHVLDML